MAEKILMGMSAAGLAASWVFGPVFSIDPAWIAILLCGIPIAKAAMEELWRERRVNSDVLVTIAILAAISIGEVFAAGEVAFIMMVGMWLEHRTVSKASSALKEMVELVPDRARRKTAEGWEEVALAEIAVGDIVMVKPGEKVPVDGVVLAGQASLNQAALTGESLPVEKRAGDEVFVGTANTNGVIEVEAVRVGEETTFSKVTQLVADALEKKAPVQRLLDRWAAWIVPSSLLLAVLVYIVTKDIVRAVTILIVFCPCALVLATPTAIMAGIGNAARQGILIKSGAALEQLGLVDSMLFDKTGTLTEGKLRVTGVAHAQGAAGVEVLRYAAALEQYSEHPIAAAIVNAAREREISLPPVDNFLVHTGSGVSATTEGKSVLVGNRRLLMEAGIEISSLAHFLQAKEAEGQTAIFVGVDGELIGMIAVADHVRAEAKETISSLRVSGVGTIGLLTGDNRYAAQHIAAQVGVTDVYAEQFPQAKYDQVVKQRGSGQVVAMVGDGINDAPALTAAHVGIAMGEGGTQIAAQSAEVVLLSSDISKIAEAIQLGRKTLHVIRQNVMVSTLINGLAILLAMTGVLGPVMGAFVHNATSALVVANSARLISFKGNHKEKQQRAVSAGIPVVLGSKK